MRTGRLSGITVEQDVGLVLPDGVRLSADIYTPDRPGRYPTLLMRLPYGAAVASAPVYCHPAWYASQGFCVVVQDVRGTWRSGGSFYPRRDELPDTLATIDWVAGLPHSNGRVGMYGFSFQGAVQLQAAAASAPALAAVAPAQTCAEFYSGWHYEGGVPLHAGAVGWGLQLAWIAALHDGCDADAARFRRLQMSLPVLLATPPALPDDVADVTWIRDWLSHETFDTYWQDQLVRPAPGVPTLWIAGWYDSFLGGTLDSRTAAVALAGPAEQSLIAGPWQHQPWSRHVGARDFGPHAVSPVDAEQLAFFRHYLLDDDLDRHTICRVFVTGLDEWRASAEWPPASVALRLFLNSDGDATGERQPGALSATPPSQATFDAFTSEPLVPVPVNGGRGTGPADQRTIERLRAVAVYTSEVFEQDVWVVGARASLSVATSGTDCDWVVRLCDVEPGSGRSLDITQGALRSRYRSGPETCEPVSAFGQVEVTVPVWPCAHLFKAGHRLRLHITGSSFPYYGRNPGSCVPTAELPAQAYAAVVQFVLHGPGQQSWLDLQVGDLASLNPEAGLRAPSG